MELDISEAALNLEFEGDFVFDRMEMVRKGDLINNPDEFVLGYFFISGDDFIYIVPDDPDTVVNYAWHVVDYKGKRSYFEAYDSNGELSIMV